MGVQISGDTGNVLATKGTYTGNLTVGGVLTYEDVTNVDSVGLITARSGIEIGARPGVAASISVDGNMIVSGISTFGGDIQVPDKIIHAGDTNTALRFPAADTISFETAGSERFRLDSSGRLLYGHTSNVTGALFQINSNANFFAASNDANGAVVDLIKTRSTTPSGNTILQDGDKIGELRFRGNTGAGSVNGATIQAIVNGTPGSGNDLPTDLAFRLMPDGSGSTLERARFTSGGSLLLGHTSSEHGDGYQLELSATNSNSSIALTAIQDNIYASQLSFVKARGSSLGSKTIVQDGDILGQFAFYGTDGTNRALGCTINVRVDGTPGNDDMPTRIDFATSNDGTQSVSNRLRLRSSGDVQIPNGNVVIQTSGKGIDFSAAGGSASGSSSALLDDYEEGTWTPSFTQGVSGGSYTQQAGHYTKVGRLVMISCRIDGNGLSANNDYLLLGGLPFTTVASGGTAGGLYFAYSDNMYSGSSGTNLALTIIVNNNATVCEFFDGDGTQKRGDDFYDVNRNIHIVGTYHAA